jgi:hypothetical protein
MFFIFINHYRKSLQKLIQTRPEEADEVKKTIDQVFRDFDVEEVDDEDDQKLIDQCEVERDEWFEDNQRDTIKAYSPFTKEFIQIEIDTERQPSDTDNVLYNFNFINYLQNNFMPYIFIWAGYVFRGINATDQYGHTITHITQGCIEKHFGTIKSQNDHTGLHPAAYASEIVNDVISTCKVLEPVKKPKNSNSKNSSLNFKFIN